MADQWDPQNWMSSLPDTLHDVPLNCLAIPGSHDSGAFYLDKDGPLNPDCSSFIKGMTQMFGGMALDVVHKWSITQSLDFTQQLTSGIRYFDMRVGVKPGTDDIHMVHELYGWPIEKCLDQIKPFLEQHPKEIVIIDFNHFYDMSDIHHTDLQTRLQEAFGEKMCMFLDMESVTLDMLWDNNMQVLVFYQHESGKDNLNFWPNHCIKAPWARCGEVPKVIDFLQANVTRGRCCDHFHVTQGVCTVDATFIMGNLLSTLKDSAASTMAPSLVQWLKKQRVGIRGVNICIMDFVEMGDYIKSVIDLNYQEK